MTEMIEIRECTTGEELTACVDLQREVFALPEVELSPVRHLIVTRNAGGFTLGAFVGDRLVGFVLSVPAFLRGERAFYSHMTAVHGDYQSHGVGARLKWAQRERSLELGIKYIKWTFEPVKARNAYFNLEKLGVEISDYAVNFYGTDYSTSAQTNQKIGLASDRLFAEWRLDDAKVISLASGDKPEPTGKPAMEIVTINDWYATVAAGAQAALDQQLRIRSEFQEAFERGLVVRGFRRDDERPAYLLYEQ